MEIIYFADHDPSVLLATPMVLWQLHNTVLVGYLRIITAS